MKHITPEVLEACYQELAGFFADPRTILRSDVLATAGIHNYRLRCRLVEVSYYDVIFPAPSLCDPLVRATTWSRICTHLHSDEGKRLW